MAQKCSGVCVWVFSCLLCPILCDPMDCSHSDSYVHGIFQARIFEWMPFTSLRAQKLAIITNILGIPCGSAGKESACNAGDLGSFPGREDPLEKGTHSSILPRDFHGLYSPWDCKESDTPERLSLTNILPLSTTNN